ncbi:hypothetical protein H4Q26_003635 [Puccinia striiformis f. sp. tritici PST-130]|nr:hypothetical protein H4Q26_003635 [Puccinia striiformis f. sp. tritici PST-130]
MAPTTARVTLTNCSVLFRATRLHKVKERLFKVVARKNAEGWRTDSDRLDWRALVWTIVPTYSNSLVQLDYLLRRDDLTAMDRAAEVRDFTYGMLIPYIDFSSWNVSDPAWIEHSIKRCARGFTFSTYRSSDLTESKEVIIGAIEGTLDRLCSTIFGIFSQTMKLSIPIDSSITHDSRLEREAKSRTSGWRRQIDELMEWLGWSTWGQCDPPCKPNVSAHVCLFSHCLTVTLISLQNKAMRLFRSYAYLRYGLPTGSEGSPRLESFRFVVVRLGRYVLIPDQNYNWSWKSKHVFNIKMRIDAAREFRAKVLGSEKGWRTFSEINKSTSEIKSINACKIFSERIRFKANTQVLLVTLTD